MFRPMRRKNRELSTETAEQLLTKSRRGVLAVNGDDGYPYAVPVNYFYDREAQKIYFHGARAAAGTKILPGRNTGGAGDRSSWKGSADV